MAVVQSFVRCHSCIPCFINMFITAEMEKLGSNWGNYRFEFLLTNTTACQALYVCKTGLHKICKCMCFLWQPYGLDSARLNGCHAI